VLRLLGISPEQLRSAIGKGVAEEHYNDRGDVVIPWEDVATLALEEWTPRMIEAALRHEADEVIPLFNQHRLIRVSLPIYLIRVLNYVAEFESASRHIPRNASDVLERVLHDFANTQDTAAIESEVSGYAQALTYPYFTPRRTGLLWLRCRYCGIAISEPVREVCRNCEHHHEPNEHLGQYGLPELEEPDEPPLQPTQSPQAPRHRRSATRPRRSRRSHGKGRRG